jgi:hypothetical protein
MTGLADSGHLGARVDRGAPCVGGRARAATRRCDHRQHSRPQQNEFGANDRPNLVGNPELSNPTPGRWFNTAAFAFPAPGRFGNAGRNIVDGPGYQNVNASLVKNTRITERVNLQFRTEFFNLFNHPNFNLPDSFLGSPTFGVISSARDPRHIQFGLKLLF